MYYKKYIKYKKKYQNLKAGHDGPCGKSTNNNYCKKSSKWDHDNCYLENGRCHRYKNNNKPKSNIGQKKIKDENIHELVYNWYTNHNREEIIQEYGNIENWDTSNVTSMERLFYDKIEFNENISKWDTSNVTNMWGMFINASNFNIDIGSWDVSKVKDMESMFEGSRSFNQDISRWNVSKVKTMKSMFYVSLSFNQNISIWDVKGVENMSYMFRNASSFNQDISNWNVKNVISTTKIFDRCDIPKGYQPIFSQEKYKLYLKKGKYKENKPSTFEEYHQEFI